MTIEREMFPSQREVEIVDAIGVPEVFCEGLGRIERIGPNRRLVFVVTQPSASGSPERLAVVNRPAGRDLPLRRPGALER